MIRVLVADDHAIVRKGLIQILRDAPEAIVVEEAEGKRPIGVLSTADVIREMREQPWFW